MPIYYPKDCLECCYGCETRVRLFTEEVSCDTGGVPVGDCEHECTLDIDIQPYSSQDQGEMIDFDPSGQSINSAYYFYYKPQTSDCADDEFVLSTEYVTLVEYLGKWYQIISIKSWRGDCCNCEGISHQEGILRLYEECEEPTAPVEYCITEDDEEWTRTK